MTLDCFGWMVRFGVGRGFGVGLRVEWVCGMRWRSSQGSAGDGERGIFEERAFRWGLVQG